MRILLLDNYDSFTYNLLHIVDRHDGVEVDVYRNDEIEVSHAESYDRIIISPGPGLPAEAGITLKMIKEYYTRKPILGVCLGMQAIAEIFGAKLSNLEKVYHGVAEETIITDKSEKLFEGIPANFKSGRYHSWTVDAKTLSADLKVTALDHEGNIMGLSHVNQLTRGIQFHPESILTEFGNKLMENWLFRC